jgi:hypothetical protein
MQIIAWENYWLHLSITFNTLCNKGPLIIYGGGGGGGGGEVNKILSE